MPGRFGLNPNVQLGLHEWIIIKRACPDEDDLRPAVDPGEDVRSTSSAKAAMLSGRRFVGLYVVLSRSDLESFGLCGQHRCKSGTGDLPAIVAVAIHKPDQSAIDFVLDPSTMTSAFDHLFTPVLETR
jgi:hypothetical protein